MDRLTLHAVRQVGDDLGLRRLGRLWERRVSGKANLGQPQNQRLNLLSCDHLRRQGGIFGQGVTHPCRPVDQRPTCAQSIDIAVKQAFGHPGFDR